MSDGVKLEALSFEPMPVGRLEALSDRERRLQFIGDIVGYWLKWVTNERSAEGLPTTADTHVMLDGNNGPPEWPSVGQLTHWLGVIRDIPSDDGWRTMESAPKDGTWVLLTGGYIDYGWDGNSQPVVVSGQFIEMRWQFAWYDGGYYGEYEKPTHWRPLPSPPEG